MKRNLIGIVMSGACAALGLSPGLAAADDAGNLKAEIAVQRAQLEAQRLRLESLERSLDATAAAQKLAAQQAASPGAAPAGYVKACDGHRSGYFYIPGTDTCLRIGGYVRVDAEYSPGQDVISAANGKVTQAGSTQDKTGLEVRGRIDIEGRTQTAWGPVEAAVSLRAVNTDGLRLTPSMTNFQTSYPSQGNGSSSLTMERGYVRFGGLTAGVANENANTMPGRMYSGNVWPGFPSGIKQIAYKGQLGRGFSGTVAIESQGDFGYFRPNASAGQAPSLVPTSAGSQYVNQPDTGYELISNVRYESPAGYFQLAGLVGKNSVGCTDSLTGKLCTTTYSPLVAPTKFTNYGVIGSFGQKLSMIAPGDEIFFEATYSHGFLGATIAQGGLSNLSDVANRRVLGGVTRVDSNIVPTLVSPTGAVREYGQTNARSVAALLTHHWNPQWRTNSTIGYVVINPPKANCSTLTADGVCAQNAGLNTQWGKGRLFQVAASLIWAPAKNASIGLEAQYVRNRSTLQNPSAAFIAAGTPGLSQSSLHYLLRLERLL